MDKFPFARRTNWPRQTNALNDVLESLKDGGCSILDLTASNPTDCGFSYPPELLAALNRAQNLHYEPQAAGLLDARHAVAKYYERQKLMVPAQDIILTASTSEAYSFLMRLLVNPGEKVLIPKPSYPLFQFLLEVNDVHFEHYPLHYDGRWRIDLQALECCIDAKTRAIILVNPNNPTGSYLSPAELQRLNELCRRNNLAIISDEVFFEYAFNQTDIISCAGNQSVLTFVLGGLSKTMGLPQMKCAWILASGPQEALQEAMGRLEIIADIYLSVNTPVQNALAPWLEMAPMIQREIIGRVQENLERLSLHIGGYPLISPLTAQGGWYVTLRIPAVKSEEDWVLEILKEDHVLVYPGYFFDFDSEAYLVVSLLPPPSIFEEATGRIFKRLSQI